MHILHITPAYKPAAHYGGPTISVRHLAEEQAMCGAQVSVYTTTANGPDELDVPTNQPLDCDGPQCWYFRRWTGDHGHFSPALLWKVWKTARNVGVVHVHSWWNWVAFGAALICRLQGVRLVLSPRGMLSPYTLKKQHRIIFQKTVGNWLLRKATIHATSAQEARELRMLLPKNPYLVLPNILELPAFDARPEGPKNALLRMLFLGRIDPKKGLDVLLDAMAGLDFPWRLCIAGTGSAKYTRQIMQQIEWLGLQKKTEWRGWVDGAEKWTLFSESDLFVLPSHNENFANAVLEALALGTPVVLSDQVGLSEYVEAQALGWICPPEVLPLRETLRHANADIEQRRYIQLHAPQKIRTDFDPKKLAKRYLNEYPD